MAGRQGSAPAAGAGRLVDAIAALVSFAACGGSYVATLAPGLTRLGGDGNELTVVAATLGLAHPTGYPLYTWLGFLFTRLVPVGEVAYRTNLMSATLGAAGVAIAYLAARRLRLRPAGAGFAALLFGVSPTFWSQAVTTEVYAPNVCALALVLWLLLRWADRVAERRMDADRAFVVFALAYGLSLGMHLSNLAFAPALALFVVLTERSIVLRPRTLAAAVAAFLLGAAQFAWLPYAAGARDLYPNAPPDTLERFHAYTLGAFVNLRFFFPPAEVPGRIAAYVAFLVENFSWPGVALGVAGAWALLWRNVRAFWLLIAMYVLHVAFFTQLFVPDPDPYFIPSNLVFALFAGAGADAVYRAVAARLAGGRRPGLAIVAPLVLGGALCAALLPHAVASFRANDQSGDSAVGDFHRGVFAFLPPGSVLVARGGAFGSAVAYFHELYGLRPDVLVPDRTRRALPAGVPVFTTPEEHPAGARVELPEGAWYVPVLRGARHDATLYRVSTEAPALIVRDATPAVRVDRALGDATLVGFDAPVVVERRIRLKTYWRVPAAAPPVVTTAVDGVAIEAHELGAGNLARYRAESGIHEGGIVVEELEVVLPGSLERGTHALRIGTIDVATGTVTRRWADLGEVSVP